MIRGKRKEWLAIGILILLAIGSAACSADMPFDSASLQGESAERNIRVYESPT